MPERIEWGEGAVRATRDLTPDIRLIEIAPSSGFVSPTPGAHVNVGVLIGDRQLAVGVVGGDRVGGVGHGDVLPRDKIRPPLSDRRCRA